jgi:HlyD family secretion protein
VKAGQVIAQIDPVVFQANVNQAEGELENARAALDLAKLNAARTQALVAKQNSAQSDLDQATANLHQAEANVKIKEGALGKAKADLDHCTITSPIDGIVISRNVDVGQTVAASLQAPVIFTIANDLSKMQIDANVAEADVGGVEIDQTVEFTVDAFPARTFQGKVVQVRNAPITVQNVVTYDTVIGVSNPDSKLKPGMTANVSIVSAHRDDALKIPNSALRFRMPDQTPSASASAPPRRDSSSPGGGRPPGGGKPGGNRPERRVERTVAVLPAGASKPLSATIKTGISDGVATEVLEGLKEGDRVVTGMTENGVAATPAANPFGGGGPRRF